VIITNFLPIALGIPLWFKTVKCNGFGFIRDRRSWPHFSLGYSNHGTELAPAAVECSSPRLGSLERQSEQPVVVPGRRVATEHVRGHVKDDHAVPLARRRWRIALGRTPRGDIGS
jgi:hypothetical protein